MIFNFFKKKEKNTDYVVKLNYNKKRPLTKRNVIDFLRSLNIEVRTNTKARGNNGIYFQNRIDIARGLKEEKAIEVLVHEFAHYIHSKTDKDFNKTGGSLETIFKTKDIKDIKTELLNVTDIIDKNNKTKIFYKAKKETSDTIKSMQKSIQKDYPEFKRSKKFAAFDRYIKNSDAKYFVNYDVIRILKGWFIKKEKILNIKNIEVDFPNLPKAFQTYLKLCSLRRKQAKISRRLNKMNKYFNKPTELFARFVQGYFFEPEIIKKTAPVTVKRFKTLLEEGYYKELKNFFDIFTSDKFQNK